MNKQFDYDGALKAGYSDEEILPFLEKSHPNFDFKAAQQSGYSLKEITPFLQQNQEKPERSALAKGGRIAAQAALGVAQASPVGMAYDLAVAPLASKDAQTVNYRENVLADIERLQEQKQMGQWDDQDQQLYDNLVNQIKNPEKMNEFVQTGPDLSIKGIAEKATGIDLHPEGILEKGANWIGWIKNPTNIKELWKSGVKAKEIPKALGISGTDVMRGFTAGTALEMAEQNQFGPLGHLAAMVVGDAAGFGPKLAKYIAQNPRKAAAQTVNFLTRGNTKSAVSKQLIEDFQNSGLSLDAGTLTQSPLVQMIQARLSQSGLTGEALQNLRKDLSSQITREYETILKEIGEHTFENNFQASEAIRDALRVQEVNLNLPKNQPDKGRSLVGRVSTEAAPDYQRNLLDRIAPVEFRTTAEAGETLKNVAQEIKTPIKEEFNHRWEDFSQKVKALPESIEIQLSKDLESFIENKRGSLLLGESAPESRVLRAAENLFERLGSEVNGFRGVTVDELIKTKRTLADVADYEFGGSNFESAYKKLVEDVNLAIDRNIAKSSPELSQEYRSLNSDYSTFKNTFENKNVLPLFEPKNQNYNSIYTQFVNNPDKLQALETILRATPEGQQVLNQVKRDFAQRVVESPNMSAREARNLTQSLGPQFARDVEDFMVARQNALETPLPRAARGKDSGVRPTAAGAEQSQRGLAGRIGETSTESSRQNVRKKMYDYLSKKSPDQIMKMFDTVEGIRKMRSVLNTTEEGKELYKQLSRFKLAEIIDNKMKDSVTQQIKLGTFSNLLKTTKNKAIVKELVGAENYARLVQLQKNAGQLAKSAERFFNASQSGTSMIDMGLLGGATTGLLTGNIFLALPAFAKIGGSYALAKVLSDRKFLQELQKVIMSKDVKTFTMRLKSLEPYAKKLLKESTTQKDNL